MLFAALGLALCAVSRAELRRPRARRWSAAFSTVAPRSRHRTASAATSERAPPAAQDAEAVDVVVEDLEAQNAANVREVLALIDADGWEPVVTEGRCKVWRRQTEGSRHVCLLAKGQLDAKPDDVYALLADTQKAPLYNEFIKECVDEEVLNPSTKISWSRTATTAMVFKARDFVTLCHFLDLDDSTRCVVNRAAETAKRPQTAQLCRGEVVLGANVISSVPGHSGKTELTLLTQVNPGGAVDYGPVAKVANQLAATSPVTFFDAIERVANLYAANETSAEAPRVRSARRSALRMAGAARRGARTAAADLQSGARTAAADFEHGARLAAPHLAARVGRGTQRVRSAAAGLRYGAARAAPHAAAQFSSALATKTLGAWTSVRRLFGPAHTDGKRR
ncbi:hypothetical protein M885DRAFT_460543 [Pelagophyceae sp. CCMP2097]|nr:hypothetical protein M885DRAFT_460543 [Pelagophyceae sp. CCMP2097]